MLGWLCSAKHAAPACQSSAAQWYSVIAAVLVLLTINAQQVA